MSGSRRAVRPIALDLAKALERGEARAIRERASVLRLLDQAEKLGIDLHVLIEGAQARLKAKQLRARLDAITPQIQAQCDAATPPKILGDPPRSKRPRGK